jgi:hypothetical protein
MIDLPKIILFFLKFSINLIQILAVRLLFVFRVKIVVIKPKYTFHWSSVETLIPKSRIFQTVELVGPQAMP